MSWSKENAYLILLQYEDIKNWYDGYYTNNGEPLFNPRSVNFSLSEGACNNFWTETSPMNEIAECIEHNVSAVYARDFYQVLREESNGKGFCGYLFLLNYKESKIHQWKIEAVER